MSRLEYTPLSLVKVAEILDVSFDELLGIVMTLYQHYGVLLGRAKDMGDYDVQLWVVAELMEVYPHKGEELERLLRYTHQSKIEDIKRYIETHPERRRERLEIGM